MTSGRPKGVTVEPDIHWENLVVTCLFSIVGRNVERKVGSVIIQIVETGVRLKTVRH